MKLSLIFLASLFSTIALADYPSHPCKTRSSGGGVDLYNSDDLYFAGRLLARNGRVLEGIECLNRGKLVAPGYLDIRLELMDAFHTLNDKMSGVKESQALREFQLTPYYQETWQIYHSKIMRITSPINPIKGFRYIDVPVLDLGHDFKKIDDKFIFNIASLKYAVELKNEGKLQAAVQVMEREVLPFNKESATVFMYSGIFHAGINDFIRSEGDFLQAMNRVGNDPDVILLLMRAMSANKNPHGSIVLAQKKAQSFIDYGCLKLGMNVADAYSQVNSTQAKKLYDYLTIAVLAQVPEESICLMIKKDYL